MVYPKKSLGQNFLRSKKALADIVGAGEVVHGEVVLEAGPGQGILTEALLSAGAHVLAVEKDDRLIPILEKKFEKEIFSKQLTLIHADILEFKPVDYKLTTTNYKLIANIPYYITGAFIRKFLEMEYPPSRMVILVQKEVAERVVARDGKESLLSISVKAYGVPKLIAVVKRGSFSPAPSVDSAILSITEISKKFFTDFSEENFFKILKTGFAHKRKMLAGNLGIQSAILSHSEISPKARAEELTLEKWKNLISKLSKKF